MMTWITEISNELKKKNYSAKYQDTSSQNLAAPAKSLWTWMCLTAWEMLTNTVSVLHVFI